MAYESLPDSETVLAQFNRLIQELLRGNMQRNTFRPWEIEILLDIEGCNLREVNKRDTLRRYQKAVQRHMEKGARLPLKLSEYLSAVKSKRAGGARTRGVLIQQCGQQSPGGISWRWRPRESLHRGR